MKPIIPEAALQQHIAVVGKTGSGKTSTAKLIVEHVVGQDARVCVLDPIKSDWWGLTSSADGKRAGLPFHILGGPRGHVPLHSAAGKAVAEVVASGSLRLSILDMADFGPGGQSQFFIDFAPALLRKMRGVLYLVIEEAHLFAPKERSGIGNENMAIHWAKTIATAGRSKGIRLLVLTQRTQALHNAILGSCDTLIAHRFTAPADQAPIEKWLEANLAPEDADKVAGSLSSLKTGEGWLCSGEAGVLERRAFPRIHTYDNTATPTGDGADVSVRTAAVDPDKLRAIIGDAVKEAEANDPKRLRAELADVKRQLEIEKKVTKGVPADPKALADAEARGYERGEIAGMKRILGNMNTARKHVRAGQAALHEAENYLGTVVDDPPAPTPRQRHATPAPAPARGTLSVPVRSLRTPTDSLPRAERAVLTAAAQRHPKTSTRAQLAILSGYSVTSSSFANACGALRSSGYLEGRGDANGPTAAGLQALGAFEPMPTGAALVEWWASRLEKAERDFLRFIAGQYPRTVTRAEISEATAYSTTSSSFANALGKLRTLELVTGRGDAIKASDTLFE